LGMLGAYGWAAQALVVPIGAEEVEVRSEVEAEVRVGVEVEVEADVVV
jgi:hypothetical protein